MNNIMKTSALVSCRWLANQLSDKVSNLRVLDCSWHLPSMQRDPCKEYAEKHITGALFFDLDKCSDKSSPYDHMSPSPEQFASYVGERGINNDTHVVVYDNNEMFGFLSAQRIWWTFRLFGHDTVSVLDGGLPKWISDGYDVTDMVDNVDEQIFKPNFRAEMIKSFDDLESNIGNNHRNFQVIDARPSGRFAGTMPEPRPGIKPGHIVGSANVPFVSMIDQQDKVMKSPEELKQVFKEAGVDLNKPLAASCGSGVSACVLAFGAHLCGKHVTVYDGSWVEWYQRARPEHKADVPED